MRRRCLVAASIAAFAVPGLARAQPARRRLAWFTSNGGWPKPQAKALWFERLAHHGYLEGQNLDIHLVPSWRGDRARLDAFMREMLAWGPDAILAISTFNVRLLQRLTTTIPVVFSGVADPEAVGIVKSLARPGGNVTGVSVHNLTLFPKRLQLIRELLPGARKVVIIIDRPFTLDGFPPRFYLEMRHVAAGLGLELLEEDITESPGGFDEAFAKAARHGPDIIVPLGAWPNMRVPTVDFVKLQNLHAIPVMGYMPQAGGAQDGLIVQLGTDFVETVHMTVEVLARVLAGAHPSEIPVRQQSTVLLVINLDAARRLGVPVPRELLQRADRVIG